MIKALGSIHTLLSIGLLLATVEPIQAARQMENLSRGIVAVPRAGGGFYVGWRLFGNDPDRIAFNLYRIDDDGPPVLVNSKPIAGATNFIDEQRKPGRQRHYFLRPVLEGVELQASSPVRVWEKDYLEIPIQQIADYRPGDASIADLDGDGELELVLHQTSRPRDNGSAGVTGTPILDAYEFDGTHSWRIDLGKNIRDGEHYTQFMVYDLDGDGRAEVACKTADGTVDGLGQVIGDPDKDWRTLKEGSRRHGRILDGPEFFTIFDGLTGAALKTVDYVPNRYPIDGWGGIGGNAGNDSYGNRCDRFLACIAYLDGHRPSVVMCRGVYGRIVMAAWDWRDNRLTSRWVFDSGRSYPPYDDASPFSGMGGHSLSVADVDDDGRDEIVYQAMVIDDDGQGLYSTGLRHGDSMHITDIDPDRPGLEIFTIQENEERAEQFQTPGAAMRDARSGEILWSHSPTVDVGSGMAADIDPTHRGYEAWGGPGGLRSAQGQILGPAPRETGWCIWWDGDLLRELLTCGRRSWRPRGPGRSRRPSDDSRRRRAGLPVGERRSAPAPTRSPQTSRPNRRTSSSGTRIDKWNWLEQQAEPIFQVDALGASRGPAIMGDMLGDWREEVILVAPAGDALRLYTTTIPTEHRLVTLWHDPQYRLGIAWQNVVYNKPCHPSFFLGNGMASPPRPEIRLIGRGEAIAGVQREAGREEAPQ